MKKIFLSFALIATASLFSQVRSKGDIEITPKIGSAASNYYAKEELSNEFLNGFTFGVEGDYFFNDRWSIHSGLLYQPMGSKIVNVFKENLNYLTIPVNANWHFGSTRKWYLNFGPSIGFLLSAKDNKGYDLADQVNSTQLGLNYGIGYKIFVNDKVSISIDYQGMSGLSNAPKYSELAVKNAYGSINVGAVLKL